MLTYTLAQFTETFPEFVNTSPTQFNTVLSMATMLFNVGRWGQSLNLGLGYFIAHELTLMNQTSAAQIGPGLTPDEVSADDVTSERIGDEAISRSSDLLKLQMQDPYMRTLYGQKYKYYMRLFCGGGISV